MRIEILIQFIVPLMFLAIWALTSLLNRDAQPLPPRPGRPPGAGGPRPLTSMPGQTEPRSPGPGTPVQTPASSPLADPQTMWPGATSAPTARTGNSAPPAQEFGRRHRLHRERPHHAGHDAARFVPGTRGGDRRGITAATRGPATQGNPGPVRHHQQPFKRGQGRAQNAPGSQRPGQPVDGLAAQQTAGDHAALLVACPAFPTAVASIGCAAGAAGTRHRQPGDPERPRHPQDAVVSRKAARVRAADRGLAAARLTSTPQESAIERPLTHPILRPSGKRPGRRARRDDRADQDGFTQ